MLFLEMGGLLYTKVLRSLHNNTQQPVIYLVEGKNVVAPVAAHLGGYRAAGLSLITRILPQNNIFAHKTS